MQPAQHGFGLCFITADQSFHTAISAVAHPAGYAKSFGLKLGVVAKADALHPALDIHFKLFQTDMTQRFNDAASIAPA